MMDPNSYGKFWTPQNYNVGYRPPDPITSNEAFYKELCTGTSNVGVPQVSIPVNNKPCSSKMMPPIAQKKEKIPAQKKIPKSKKPPKKRAINKENSRKQQRMKRLKGDAYIDSKGRLHPSRPMKDAPCRGKEKHKGCNTIPDEDRMLIYSEFRDMKTYQAQWQFMAAHVVVHVKRRKTSVGPSRREYTHVYYLTVKGEKIKVCREFFMATLNVTEGQIRTSLNKLSPHGICQDDKRGRRAPKNKVCGIREEYLRRHILSFPTTNKKNSVKKYVEGNLTVSEMHKLYVERCNEGGMKPVSLEKYRLIVKEYNIAFQKQKGGHPKSAKLPKMPMKQSCNPSVSDVMADCNMAELVQQQDVVESDPQVTNAQVNYSSAAASADNLNVGIATNNENLAIASYIIGFETAKGYNDKGIPNAQRPPQPSMSFPMNTPQPPFYGNFNGGGYFAPSANGYTPNNVTPPLSNGMPIYSNSNTLPTTTQAKPDPSPTSITLHVDQPSHMCESPSPSKSTIPPLICQDKVSKLSRRADSRIRKLRGESYVDSKGKIRPSRPMKEATCRGKKKHRECDRVSDDDRKNIYEEFRQLTSYEAQWQFIGSHVISQGKNRCTSKGPSRREKTFVYYFTAHNEKIKVCREFFLSTLHVTEGMVKSAVNKLSPQGMCQEDRRGRKPPKNKLSPEGEEFLRRHITSYPTTTRKNSTKKFLDSQLTVVDMHKDYVKKCKELLMKPVSAEKYRLVFKEYNLSFHKVKKAPPKNHNLHCTVPSSTVAQYQPPPPNPNNAIVSVPSSQYIPNLPTHMSNSINTNNIGQPNIHMNHQNMMTHQNLMNNPINMHIGPRNNREFDERLFKNPNDHMTGMDLGLRSLIFMPEGT